MRSRDFENSSTTLDMSAIVLPIKKIGRRPNLSARGVMQMDDITTAKKNKLPKSPNSYFSEQIMS